MTTDANAPRDILASPRVAADLAGVSESAVRGWVLERRLRAMKLGGGVVVRVDQVIELAAGLAPVGRL